MSKSIYMKLRKLQENLPQNKFTLMDRNIVIVDINISSLT